MEAYRELGYEIDIDDPAAPEPANAVAPNPDPAVGGLVQELTPVQRAYRDELLDQPQEVKARKAAHKAARRQLRDDSEWRDAAVRACQEEYEQIIAELKAI